MDSLFRIHQSTNKGDEMVSKRTIQFILEWIENHLEQRVSIEDITRLSGYSRRHIQQLFKKYTNISLGEYIRRRKLCRAAALVRLTSMSMLDIAILMSFDSQQSFSREFKKVFGCSPREYRKKDTWDLIHVCPSYSNNSRFLPKCKLLVLDEMQFTGQHIFNYDSFAGNGFNSHKEHRYKCLTRGLKQYKDDIYYLSRFEVSPQNTDVIFVATYSGTRFFDTSSASCCNVISSPGGVYAFFHFEGTWDEYIHLPRRIYLEVLPAHQLARCDGYDIERFYKTQTNLENNINKIVCDYYIPVKIKSPQHSSIQADSFKSDQG
ncbi:helix-turn-helix domain-containing protein [Salmonella enterica subsp. enterica serovar Brandenburg]|nr:helix-turn-helix domain-containing protein [Salmonella enterica subsp. enterica serovar Brandenburg]ECA2810572.1 helix-turn-helix domain-containing protein [Salmonella enterica subsp. enterica serovar Newport]EDU8832243.1 helix-turn-helix domain-containing protein [Salmonella enterica subsp. enterica]RXQ39641.1 helix-turn-helix domain-containing protein [Salmonella enterica]EBW5389685.1 AraC family transcriptional regulator [Salmonella enterica subsp. enterica serovar Brandenburg]